MKRCPQCGAQVDEIAIFCDNCDAVLDTEALLQDEEPQGIPPPPITKNVRHSTTLKKKEQPRPVVTPTRDASKRVESPPFTPRQAQKKDLLQDTAEVQLRETFDEMLLAFKRMGIGQKVGLVSALLSFVFSFFPWVSVPQEGSVPGLDVGGLYLVIIATVYFSYIVLDYTGAQFVSNFEQYRLLILVSLGFLGILLCTYRVIFPYDIDESTTVLKDIGLKLDIHRKFGLFLASASTLAMFISPLLGGFVKKD
ncbi:MAG: zinc ribbon domain-containing protein [Deltaproteobacteria bacterium]|nr:zinc ribbon domain-containing protein [Deltaproteobacteria bacterium]